MPTIVTSQIVLRFTEGRGDKFYEITYYNNDNAKVRWGRWSVVSDPSGGQDQILSAELANKRLNEKLNKGYVVHRGTRSSPSSKPPQPGHQVASQDIPTATHPPTGVRPMLADSMEYDSESYKRRLLDPLWWAEQKFDGHRLILRATADGIETTTRNGTPYSKGLPKGMHGPYPPGEWMLDGELVDDTYHVFDLLHIPTGDLRSEPLETRRMLLEAAFDAATWPPAFQLAKVARTLVEKQALVESCKTNAAEGVMLKHKVGLYTSGRSVNFAKVKFTETADCVVSELSRNGKEALGLAMLDMASGKFVEVGACSWIGKDKSVQVGDVVEVKYLYLGANGRLYQPRFLRKRTDKGALECTTDQLKRSGSKEAV